MALDEVLPLGELVHQSWAKFGRGTRSKATE